MIDAVTLPFCAGKSALWCVRTFVNGLPSGSSSSSRCIMSSSFWSLIVALKTTASSDVVPPMAICVEPFFRNCPIVCGGAGASSLTMDSVKLPVSPGSDDVASTVYSPEEPMRWFLMQAVRLSPLHSSFCATMAPEPSVRIRYELNDAVIRSVISSPAPATKLYNSARLPGRLGAMQSWCFKSALITTSGVTGDTPHVDPMVSVTSTVFGLPSASGDATTTWPVYVPGAIPAGSSVTVRVASPVPDGALKAIQSASFTALHENAPRPLFVMAREWTCFVELPNTTASLIAGGSTVRTARTTSNCTGIRTGSFVACGELTTIVSRYVPCGRPAGLSVTVTFDAGGAAPAVADSDTQG